jgi:hypothetical protein
VQDKFKRVSLLQPSKEMETVDNYCVDTMMRLEPTVLSFVKQVSAMFVT